MLKVYGILKRPQIFFCAGIQWLSKSMQKSAPALRLRGTNDSCLLAHTARSKKQKFFKYTITKSLLTIVILVIVGQAKADIATSTLNFFAPEQSFWGPGGSSASINFRGSVGLPFLGVDYSVIASTGTVTSSFGGIFKADYEKSIIRGEPWSPILSFSGSDGSISSFFGASINVVAHAFFLNGCLLCANYALDPGTGFRSGLDQLVSASDRLALASPGIGIGIPFVGDASAGVALAISQSLQFVATDIEGEIIAQNSVSGETISRHFDIDLEGQDIQLDPFQFGGGKWDISFDNLTLENSFSTNFGFLIDPFVAYRLGIFYGNCGNPGSDADNGFGCFADDKLVWHLPGFELYRTPVPFALNFSELSGPAFSVTVVPEPEMYVLMLAGLGVLSIVSRRRYSLNLAV